MAALSYWIIFEEESLRCHDSKYVRLKMAKKKILLFFILVRNASSKTLKNTIFLKIKFQSIEMCLFNLIAAFFLLCFRMSYSRKENTKWSIVKNYLSGTISGSKWKNWCPRNMQSSMCRYGHDILPIFVLSEWQCVALPTCSCASVHALFYSFHTFLDHSTNYIRKTFAPRRVSVSGVAKRCSKLSLGQNKHG